MRLIDRVAIITGASSGMGRATAYLFTREGAKVVVADINDKDGKETVATIKSQGGEAIFVHVDVSVSSEVQNLINETIKAYGKIDILFNNAGISHKSSAVEDMDESQWDLTYAVNVKAMFLAAKYAVPYMKKAGHGVIINTGSMSGVRPRRFSCDYASSKGAVNMLTKSLALDLAPDNIRVNCINPGPTFSLMEQAAHTAGISKEEHEKEVMATIPMGKKAHPEDIANAALFLASDESSMITGTSMEVSGGRGI
ncbi:SDR family oxidoreductase [Chloroflexota bacterium]